MESRRTQRNLATKIDKEDKPSDVGFHLLADSLNGPTNPLNVVPGNGKPIGDGLANLNQGAYASLERTIRKMASSSAAPVEIRVTPQYTAGNLSRRPDTIVVEVRSGAQDWTVDEFLNKAPKT